MEDIRTTPEVAAAVLTVIPDYRRWTKGQYEAGNGKRHCIVGAVKHLNLNISVTDFYSALGKIITSEYPDRQIFWSLAEVPEPMFITIDFNDHPDTKYSDVRRILEKVAAG